jgi:hypothetical protein
MADDVPHFKMPRFSPSLVNMCILTNFVRFPPTYQAGFNYKNPYPRHSTEVKPPSTSGIRATSSLFLKFLVPI